MENLRFLERITVEMICCSFVIEVVSIFQRDDIEVVDEPLYAAFLKATGFDRPYRDEVFSKMVSLHKVTD